MAITATVLTTSTGSAGSSSTITGINGTGVDTMVFLAAVRDTQAADRGILSVVRDGQSFQEAVVLDAHNRVLAAVWYRDAPTSGSASLTVTHAGGAVGNRGYAVVGLAASGTISGGPEGTTTNSGTGTSATLSIAHSDDAALLTVGAKDASGSVTVTDGSEVFNFSGGRGRWATRDDVTGAGPSDMDVSWASSTDWCAVGASWVEGATPAADARQRAMMVIG